METVVSERVRIRHAAVSYGNLPVRFRAVRRQRTPQPVEREFQAIEKTMHTRAPALQRHRQRPGQADAAFRYDPSGPGPYRRTSERRREDILTLGHVPGRIPGHRFGRDADRVLGRHGGRLGRARTRNRVDRNVRGGRQKRVFGARHVEIHPQRHVHRAAPQAFLSGGRRKLFAHHRPLHHQELIGRGRRRVR